MDEAKYGTLCNEIIRSMSTEYLAAKGKPCGFPREKKEIRREGCQREKFAGRFWKITKLAIFTPY
jgi:hypothetical protein